jgi:hypothetical protein
MLLVQAILLALRVRQAGQVREEKRREEKTTLGWVVNGGRRQAERQGELIDPLRL